MKDSPFASPSLSHSKSFFQTQTKWQIIDSVQRSIPFLRDLPSDSVLPVSFIIISILVSLFLVIFILGYYSSENTTFLSPLDSIGSDRYCTLIKSTNTGSYFATKSGYWQNSNAFQYTNASYMVTVTSYATSSAEYANLMIAAYQSILAAGEKAIYQDLAINLINWMTIVFLTPGSTSQRLYLVGDPAVVFNRQHHGGTISSIHGNCNLTSLTNYDSNSGIFHLSYDYEDFVGNEVCNLSAQPIVFGYKPYIDSGLFSIQFDVYALITAIGINLQVLFLENIEEIPGFRRYYTYQGYNYTVSSYYNPIFAGMQPITCSSGFNNFILCGLTIGDVYAIPIFNHAGADDHLPKPCDCYHTEDLLLQYPYANCNLFSFISGFIFWNTASPDQVYDLVIKYDSDYLLINSLAFNASFIDSYWGKSSKYAQDLQSIENREKAYGFCNTDTLGTCSIVIFSSFDDSYQANWAISKYYYQIQNGACRNTITPDINDW